MFSWDKNKPLIVDGGLGTMLHTRGLAHGEQPDVWNITHPEVLAEVHRAYLDAGAQVVTTNTFGANRLKFPPGGKYELREVIAAAIHNARAAIQSSPNACSLTPNPYIAFDVGPSGRLLEPLGSLPFEEAVSIFREMGELAAAQGVDFFFIETMTDLTEIRAAMIGLKEAAPEVPIFASFSVEESGRLLTGCPPAALAVTLEGLGAAALGVNCGAGPERVKKILPELKKHTTLPIISQPNAGLPVMRDGQTTFELSPEEFARQQLELYEMGASVMGGCCGTTPEHIKAMARLVHGDSGRQIAAPTGAFISGSRDVVSLPAEIAAAEIEEDWDDLLDSILDLADEGAQIVAVNVDVPGIAEGIAYIQQQVSLPLMFVSANPACLEAALRRYTGKALVQFSGTEDIAHLLKKYGGEMAL